MTAPVDHSEEVAGADELPEDGLYVAARLGRNFGITPRKLRTEWKPLYLHAVKEAAFWRTVTLYLGVTLALTIAALAVAVR